MGSDALCLLVARFHADCYQPFHLRLGVVYLLQLWKYGVNGKLWKLQGVNNGA